MSTYVVGDVQGCYDALQRLLEHIRFDPAADRLWCAGDLVNRGGQSLETLRLLHGLGDRFLTTLGNHDLFLLREDWKYPDGGSGNRELDRILQAPDRPELMHWLRHMPLAHWAQEHGVLILHAGVIPQWTRQDTLDHAAEIEARLRSDKAHKFFAKMGRNRVRRWKDERTGWKRRSLITDILTRLRFCDANGKVFGGASGPPGSAKKPYKAWFKHKHRQTRDTTIVFGHWAALGLYTKKNVVCLDTGCVWGGTLTALRLEDRQLFQVPGKTRKPAR
ncbi:MAG: symmetrical bis(5'-nucleosyl)-tetraphosphatase [Xanthomonadales bacterium]